MRRRENERRESRDWRERDENASVKEKRGRLETRGHVKREKERMRDNCEKREREGE